MKVFLYLELFIIVILGFFVSYKVAEKSNITKTITYKTIKQIEIKSDTNNHSSKAAKSNFKITTAKIFKKYGYIFINNKKANLNDNIKVGDIIKTSSYSYVIIKFSNGAIIRVNPNSKLKIDNLETKKDDTFKLHIMLGSILSHFSKKGKYRINTKTATVGVRGTTFFTKVASETQTTICACHGNIDFSDNNHEKLIKSDHHQVFSLNKQGFVSNVKPLVADVLRLHNDADIAELKAIANSDKIITNSNFDYKYSINNKTLKKALNLLKNKKGLKAIVALSKIGKKDAIASYLIGKTLYEGNGIKQNKSKGIKWLKISAKEKFPSAVEYLKSL